MDRKEIIWIEWMLVDSAEDSGIFFRPFALRRPKTSVPSGTLIRSLSFRASSRYVFSPKDNVLDPTDCRKRLVSGKRGRRIKIEGMVKSVKRLRKNRGVLGVRNRILPVARRVGKMAKVYPGEISKGRTESKRNGTVYLMDIPKEMIDTILHYIWNCTFRYFLLALLLNVWNKCKYIIEKAIIIYICLYKL